MNDYTNVHLHKHTNSQVKIQRIYVCLSFAAKLRFKSHYTKQIGCFLFNEWIITHSNKYTFERMNIQTSIQSNKQSNKCLFKCLFVRLLV